MPPPATTAGPTPVTPSLASVAARHSLLMFHRLRKNLKQFAIWDAGIRDCPPTVGLSNLL
ncbi:hypothetical protein [Microcoleus sp. herbarium2]|uniref:hypothetical protein n=1 Tax=Microcoleus sp. herbarium2 TaxID=3055433 RepID=UPI002FCEA8D7